MYAKPSGKARSGPAEAYNRKPSEVLPRTWMQYVTEYTLCSFSSVHLTENTGDASNEHRQRFHHDSVNGKYSKYKGKWSLALLGDACWNLKRDTPATPYEQRRQN